MNGQPKHVLVVDDNAEFADIVVAAAQREGFTARIATNGLKAIELCREFAPDTIVLDIVMPEMDGMEFIDWLAKNGYRVRLIIISGYSRYTDLAEKMASIKGLTLAAVLPKPVRLPQLIAAINS